MTCGYAIECSVCNALRCPATDRGDCDDYTFSINRNSGRGMFGYDDVYDNEPDKDDGFTFED